MKTTPALILAASLWGSTALAAPQAVPTAAKPAATDRLASTYAQLGRVDEALAANQRALAKTNGDRRVSAYRTRVALFEKKGDKGEAKKTLEEAIKFAQTLPGPGGPATVAALKKQLEQYNKSEIGD